MYDPNVISILNTPRLCLSLFFCVTRNLTASFCKHFENSDFFTNSPKFLRRFCGDFQNFNQFCGDFAAIFCPNMENFSKSGNSPFAHKKSGIPFVYWVFPNFLPWVPGGTRTHDIQNHNLTL